VLRIRDILAYQAKNVGASFVDPIAQRWFVGRPDLIGKDGVHPTDAGHVYLADKIAPLIGSQMLWSGLSGAQPRG
jgi:lysophospholipase L1-like esterase